MLHRKNTGKKLGLFSRLDLSMNIKFHHQAKISFSQRQLLKTFIGKIFEMEKTPLYSLNIVFCDEQFLLDINKRFLGHHYHTDIITFDYGTTGKGVEGELYISVDAVKLNALHFKVSVQLEFLRVIFHGILHLCGYSDKTKQEKNIMRGRENHYLGLYQKFHG